MENIENLHCRVYIPASEAGANNVNTEEYLNRYLQDEFPASQVDNKVYSIPEGFAKCGEKQATLAEQMVFDRLKSLANSSAIRGAWVLFFHNASYAGRSFRNQRYGKLMVREHDFVIFIRYNGRCYIALSEVKSTNDPNTNIEGITITSDARVIKNNKRSAQHQLRDHVEVLKGLLGDNAENIQNYIMWPFLGRMTKDPKQTVVERWKEDKKLHVFEDVLSSQTKFDNWFLESVLSGTQMDPTNFSVLLQRFILLSCGVFVEEIHQKLVALMTQEQLQLLDSDYCNETGGKALVVHGPAGTGKTLLILKKLEQLYQAGELNENNRALYICYWPGIRFEVQCKLQLLGLSDFVDTTRFFISQNSFLKRNKQSYKHIFMDEAEAICLAFEATIASRTISTILEKYYAGNSHCNSFINENNNTIYNKWGSLWFLVDINQASLFLPKHSPEILKTPNIRLTKVMRSTGNIFKLLQTLTMPGTSIGHQIIGPPVYWVNTESSIQNTLIDVVIDLCSTKGFKPNDMCVIPFLVNDTFIPDSINMEIQHRFVENGYRPKGVGDVEKFIESKEVNDFLISWALRVKGLEFKVVVMIVDEDDFDRKDVEDCKKIYIIASRCTCMLIVISPMSVREVIDSNKEMTEYQFGKM